MPITASKINPELVIGTCWHRASNYGIWHANNCSNITACFCHCQKLQLLACQYYSYCCNVTEQLFYGQKSFFSVLLIKLNSTIFCLDHNCFTLRILQKFCLKALSNYSLSSLFITIVNKCSALICIFLGLQNAETEALR